MKSAVVTPDRGNEAPSAASSRVTPLPPAIRYPGWRSICFTGLVLWLASLVVTALTGNPNILPTVVLLGSFLVPATAVVWYLDHYQSPELTPGVVVRAASPAA